MLTPKEKRKAKKEKEMAALQSETSQKLDENEKAIEKAEKLLSYAPNHNLAFAALKDTYFNKGDYRTALNYMTLGNNFEEETRRRIMDIHDEKGYKQIRDHHGKCSQFSWR